MMTRSCLGACLGFALAGFSVPALAAPPGCGTAPQPVALQVQAEQMIAQANAMFRDMTAEMNVMQVQMAALFSAVPILGPRQMVSVAFGPDSSTVGTCSETITYLYPANGGRPIIHVAQRGDACGAIHLNGPGLVPAAQPVPRRVVPRVIRPRHEPQLIEAEYGAPPRRG